MREKLLKRELDEHHIEHLKELGLFDEENPGEEYISRL